jgi:hypothetical protein
MKRARAPLSPADGPERGSELRSGERGIEPVDQDDRPAGSVARRSLSEGSGEGDEENQEPSLTVEDEAGRWTIYWVGAARLHVSVAPRIVGVGCSRRPAR